MTGPQNPLAPQEWVEIPVPPPDQYTEYPPRAAPTRKSVFELQSMLSIAVIVLFAITFVVQAFRVPSESMETTLLPGDFLLADKLHFANDGKFWSRILPYRPIRRGDIIVFRYPVDPSTYFVKRVVGLPGDRIHLDKKVLYINGAPFKESYAVHQLREPDSYRDNFPRESSFPGSVNEGWQSELHQYVRGGELVVPADRYFVMGDNRDRSSDSRYWGFVPRGNVMGRPLVIYLSLGDRPHGQAGGSDDKLSASGQIAAHFLQLARWDRMFHVVR